MSSNGHGRLRFGNYELDCESGKLLQNGWPVKIQPQPFRVLSLLLERPGEVFSREEIRNRIWGGTTFVEFDQGLNYRIRQIRLALRDNVSTPAYIETVPKQGYRFLAAVDLLPNGTSGHLSEPEPIAPATTPPAAPAHGRSVWLLVGTACIGAALVLAGLFWMRPHHPVELQYTQLTDFADSASGSVLSPDGRMLAFVRGPEAFFTSDQIYIKVLPNGEPRRLTDDSSYKYAPAFSPDGSQLAYAIVDGNSFDTKVVSVLGGESRLLLANAGGLTWLGPEDLLFSRIPSGFHMGVVRGTLNGEHRQRLYLPEHEQGLAFYSFASPDHKAAIVVEMADGWAWSPCKLISLDRAFSPRQVGPAGSCTAAAWSPDGPFMYFTVSVKGARHLWRQAYPNGTPEQITTGPTEEEGVVVEPGGRSVLTALGKRESSISLHEANGDRVLVNEGEILGGRLEEPSPPSFSPDGKFIYYLARQKQGTLPELWRVEINSARREAVFPGISIKDYDISADGKEILYMEDSTRGGGELHIRSLDGSSPPVPIPVSGALLSYFGPRGKILVVRREGNSNYLEQMNRDGSGRHRAIAKPIVDNLYFSPSHDWVVTIVASPGDPKMFIGAFALNGGPSREFCSESPCYPVWSPDGKWLLLYVGKGSEADAARTLAIPLAPGKTSPDVPAGGIRPNPEPKALPGSFYVNHAGFISGSTPFRYAYLDNRDHRNIYRISLP